MVNPPPYLMCSEVLLPEVQAGVLVLAAVVAEERLSHQPYGQTQHPKHGWR
jgi:hypothetical protein